MQLTPSAISWLIELFGLLSFDTRNNITLISMLFVSLSRFPLYEMRNSFHFKSLWILSLIFNFNRITQIPFICFFFLTSIKMFFYFVSLYNSCSPNALRVNVLLLLFRRFIFSFLPTNKYNAKSARMEKHLFFCVRQLNTSTGLKTLQLATAEYYVKTKTSNEMMDQIKMAMEIKG